MSPVTTAEPPPVSDDNMQNLLSFYGPPDLDLEALLEDSLYRAVDRQRSGSGSASHSRRGSQHGVPGQNPRFHSILLVIPCREPHATGQPSGQNPTPTHNESQNQSRAQVRHQVAPETRQVHFTRRASTFPSSNRAGDRATQHQAPSNQQQSIEGATQADTKYIRDDEIDDPRCYSDQPPLSPTSSVISDYTHLSQW